MSKLEQAMFKALSLESVKNDNLCVFVGCQADYYYMTTVYGSSYCEIFESLCCQNLINQDKLEQESFKAGKTVITYLCDEDYREAIEKYTSCYYFKVGRYSELITEKT